MKTNSSIHLPNELPPPITPESLNGTNGSQAVEMALVQNTDLMNRLSLALKRTAHLEARLNFSERNSHQRKEKLSVLDDEIQILRSNQNQVHSQLKNMSTRIAQSEEKYAILYQKYLQKEEQIKNYQKHLEHFKNLSKNLQMQSQTDLTSLVDYHEKRYIKLQRSQQMVKEQLQMQRQKISDLESQKSSIREQLVLSQNQVQLLEKKLKSFHEESAHKLKQNSDLLTHYKRQIQEKDSKVTQLEAKVSHLANLQAEFEKVQEERDRLKIRLQSKEIEYQEIKDKLLESEKSKTAMAAQNNLLTDQVEGFKYLLDSNFSESEKTMLSKEKS